MKLSSLPWVLVPGMGQIRGGAPGFGVVLFTLFLLALNGYLLSALLTVEGAFTALGFAALGVWLVSMADGLRRIARNRNETR